MFTVSIRDYDVAALERNRSKKPSLISHTKIKNDNLFYSSIALVGCSGGCKHGHLVASVQYILISTPFLRKFADH